MQTTAIAQRRRLAVILILITDIGIIAWGAMAALLPEHLLGPGSTPILKAEFESYTSASWSTLSGTSPAIAEFITILFRMYGTFNVVFGLMAVAITVTAFRRGDRWAWWALLVGNRIRSNCKRHRNIRDVRISRPAHGLCRAGYYSAFPCKRTSG